ncbi:MAG: cytochrome c3 family protein [Thermodesulfobacteriota bacterium]
MKIVETIKAFRALINARNLKLLLKSKWVIFGVGPIVTLIGVAFVIWVGHLLTTHPTICLSCHARQSSLPMWAPSKIHPERVTCVNCHAKPGQLFPRYFFADERVNENCLVCHKSMTEKELEEAHHVKIAHKLHVEDSKLMCIDCHRNIAHEKIEAGTNRPRKLTCMECHEEDFTRGPEACMKCHIKIPVKSLSSS